MTDKSITETLKAKLEELEIERHLNELVDETEKVVGQAVGKVGELTHQRRGDIDGFLDRASETINEKTDGKYADQVSRVVLQVREGVTRLAAHRPVDDAGDPAGPAEPTALPEAHVPHDPIDPSDPTT